MLKEKTSMIQRPRIRYRPNSCRQMLNDARTVAHIDTKTTREFLRRSRPRLTAERLREVLSYDPLTGEFRRRVATCNAVRVGEIAGAAAGRGYLTINIDGAKCYAHRLAVLYMTGKFPKSRTDHIDQNTANNAWANLRHANASSNAANSRLRRNNTSGFKGVHWAAQKRKWCAQIRLDGRKTKLGYFDIAEEAHAAYMTAAIGHFGEFASAGNQPK